MSASSNPIEREVRAYLREHYGVREAVLSQGSGGHPRLAFEHRGIKHKLTLPNPGMDRGLAAQLKFQDIRRLLGPPTTTEATPEKRKLEDMMPPPIAIETKALGEVARVLPAKTEPKPRSYRGTCALTISPSMPNKTRFRICIPDDLYQAFGHEGAVKLTVLGDDTIQVLPHPDRERKTPSFNRSGRFWMTINEMIFPINAQLFGSSPAEMILVDGSIVARIIEKRPVGRTTKRSEATPIVKDLSNEKNTTKTSNPAEEMRDLLRRINEVEAASPYRLVKLEGHGWVWRAPTIRLMED